MSRQQKTWLVTGCSSGLGRAIAEEVLASGNRVVVTARSIDSARAIALQFPDRALALAVDVTDPAAVEAAVSTADAWSGGTHARHPAQPDASSKTRGAEQPTQAEGR